MYKMKRGQEAQFNWIFILVAGVIILGFFSVFIFKYIELENKKASFKIVREFNNQLDLLERTSVLGKDLIRLGIVSKVEFSCNNDINLAIVNDQTDLAYKMGDKIMFAPNSVRDKKFGAWIYEWNYPFLVTNFLYLTSSKFNYIFVGNTPEEINKIPDDVFNLEFVSSESEINIKDPYNTKVIFFNYNNNADELINKYKGLEVISINLESKKVRFDNTNEEADYYGDALLYGAIFAGNYENYKCAANNAIKKLGLVSEVYSKRAYLLGLSGNKDCRYSILDSILSYFKNFKPGLEGLEQNMNRLKDQNMELHGKGCIALF